MHFANTTFSRGAAALTFLSMLMLIVTLPALAQSETTLYSFGGTSGDGQQPFSGLAADAKGNLYGTTLYGGSNSCPYGYGCGTVFKITQNGTETVLYSFGSHPGDGYWPEGVVTIDKAGNLYGITNEGGAHGVGTVFKLAPNGTETVLYSFGSYSGDGRMPWEGVTFDAAGNLYGTTHNGGVYNDNGTVYKITPTGTESVLYSFKGGTDGCYPSTPLVLKKKALYGTTVQCGAYGMGTLFKVTLTGAESVLYSFGGKSGDGSYPSGGLVFDKAGNLYGGSGGGAYNSGAVFQFTPAGVETVFYSFGGYSGDGDGPWGMLALDKAGNLYGGSGGGAYYVGTVFKITPTGAETFLYSFGSQSGDGHYPGDGVILGKKNILYGTATNGGAYGYGTVYKVTP